VDDHSNAEDLIDTAAAAQYRVRYKTFADIGSSIAFNDFE
jgi:hypothetical protein